MLPSLATGGAIFSPFPALNRAQPCTLTDKSTASKCNAWRAGLARLLSESAVFESDAHEHVLQLPLLRLGQPDHRRRHLVLRLRRLGRRRPLHNLRRLRPLLVHLLSLRVRHSGYGGHRFRLLQQVLPEIFNQQIVSSSKRQGRKIVI